MCRACAQRFRPEHYDDDDKDENNNNNNEDYDNDDDDNDFKSEIEDRRTLGYIFVTCTISLCCLRIDSRNMYVNVTIQCRDFFSMS